MSSKIEIPGSLNIVISCCSYAAAMVLLWLAANAESLTVILVAAMLFSFVANTIFSLLHESVHRTFHNRDSINTLFGRVSAAFFPTGFQLQKICHLGHHRRNRTDLELFDYYTQGDNLWVKYYRLYSILLGFYWLTIPLSCLLFVFVRAPLETNKRFYRMVEIMGFAPMMVDVLKGPNTIIRAEILFTIGFQIALFILLDLSWQSWLLCYTAFALNWCALQYTDHAWTPRDIINGAWNLRVSRPVQAIFLNYHLHLAHHQYPHVPWIHLPKFVDHTVPRPRFLNIYLSLWKGPRYTREPAPTPVVNPAD